MIKNGLVRDYIYDWNNKNDIKNQNISKSSNKNMAKM